MQSGTRMFLSLDLYHIGTLLRHSHPFWYSIWLMWLWPIFIRRLDADGVSWCEERLRDLKKGCVTQVCLRDSWMSFEPWEILVTCVTWQPQQGKAQGCGPPAPHQHSTALKTSGNLCSWLWFLIGQWSQSNRFLSTLRFQGFCKSFSLLTVLTLRFPIYWITMQIECSWAWVLNIKIEYWMLITMNANGFAPETIIRTEDFE